jgi:hypothetical protein
MTAIITLLNQVQDDEIVLPAIQRDFVWSEEQTETLLDSIMRGYPIGIVLLWETYVDIQYRSFVRDYRSGVLPTFSDNRRKRRLRVVLDGQQRLQSLYVALFGTRNGKKMYFDVLSGVESDDVAEDRYFFYTMTKKDADAVNRWARQEAKLPPERRDDDWPEYRLSVSELFALNARQKMELTRDLTARLRLDDDYELRLDQNIATFDEVFTKDQAILHATTIDESLPSESPYRKREGDVLEIFVRINREGTRLSRSDLIFSMLKLNWKESAEGLPEFVQAINRGNAFDIDTDFVVRCLFAVSDLGTRLEIDLLRKQSNVKKLRDNFERCCDAIRATVDFVKSECKCESARLIGGINTLVPVVYYFFHLENHDVPNSEVSRLRSSIFLFAFAKPFSRYIDSRSGAYINSQLRPLVASGSSTFPLGGSVAWTMQRENVESLDGLIDRNDALALHLVQGLTGGKAQYRRNSPEIDHIFPRAQLIKKGYAESEINSFANFWILAQGKNRNKSDKHPKDYFGDVSAADLKRALIEKSKLDYRRFPTFLKTRRERLLKKISRETGLTDELLERTGRDV